MFVCYSHDDAGVVYPELAWLRDQAVNIWYDEPTLATRPCWNASTSLTRGDPSFAIAPNC